MSSDPHWLSRFVEAQESVYDRALSELKSGRKKTHWMWYVFPQFAGLGSSAASEYYAIRSVDEARSYLEHPLLGPRLMECAEAVLEADAASATEMLGSPDDMKLRSSATLFAHVSPPGSVFQRILDRYYGGEGDARTVNLIGQPSQ